MLLIIMLTGFVLCLVAVYFFAGPLTDVFCHLRVWLLSLGFALIIGYVSLVDNEISTILTPP